MLNHSYPGIKTLNNNAPHSLKKKKQVLKKPGARNGTNGKGSKKKVSNSKRVHGKLQANQKLQQPQEQNDSINTTATSLASP